MCANRMVVFPTPLLRQGRHANADCDHCKIENPAGCHCDHQCKCCCKFCTKDFLQCDLEGLLQMSSLLLSAFCNDSDSNCGVGFHSTASAVLLRRSQQLSCSHMADTVGCCVLERMGVSLMLADSSNSCACWAGAEQTIAMTTKLLGRRRQLSSPC
jgi:hypothetical protein